MKTLYYCFGGGLGHLTRFIAWCHTTSTQPMLLTNCEAAKTPGLLPEGVRYLMPEASDQADKSSLQKWLKENLRQEKPQQLIVDAFPGGILGELCGMPELAAIECTYLARILRLERYLPRLEQSALPHFARIFRLETLKNDHENFIQGLGGLISDIELFDPPEPESDMNRPDISHLPASGFDLIVHSGSEKEVLQLLRFALETAALRNRSSEVVLACPGPAPAPAPASASAILPAGAQHINIYPAGTIIHRAGQVFSGAGFNIMRQMKHTNTPHHVLPFERALDDQFFRAAHYKKA